MENAALSWKLWSLKVQIRWSKLNAAIQGYLQGVVKKKIVAMTVDGNNFFWCTKNQAGFNCSPGHHQDFLNQTVAIATWEAQLR